MKVIQLSYGHLSDHLKSCFWYLASYSKDKDIMISELKDLWSDEGLLEPTDLKSVEEVMEVYVDEFISSSVVTVRGGREERCQIHDLVHDFCSIKSRKEKLFDLMSSTIPSSSSSSSDPMLRGMTIHYDEDLHTSEFPFLSNPENKNPCAKHLLSLKIHLKYEFWHTCVVLYNCHLRHLKLLKMWDLRKVITDESFPVLEELYIKCCDKIIEIPESFGDIASLKLIKVYGSPQLKESALKIKEYVEEITGEDKLEVEIGS
ncbi:hypothetical protein CQW23_12805 [Capsicum baccatum]|uniref:Disease resistance protein winged helix domain-containing protein n=1 Tax=Capsicum baccatum TaxID=33114 RepID=A0A2G2WTM5_CAPBA|nr:hypothetical protein CQW23_12805 [Capsicum baccatum]